MTRLALIGTGGGVGKTVITATLADLADPPLTLVDCSLENPNLELIVRHEVLEAIPFEGPVRANIAPDACMRCRRCMANCRFGAIRESEGVPFVFPWFCAGCGLCAAICPADAIRMTMSVAGELVHSRAPKGPFLHGRSLPGADESGLMVRQLWKLAAIRRARDGWLIADGPRRAGHHLAYTLENVDAVLLVTEPTLFSLQRMQHLIRALHRVRSTVLVVINRFDMSAEGTRETEEIAGSEGIPIVGRIPFDRAVMNSLDKGLPVTRFDSDASRAIRRLWTRVQRELGESQPGRLMKRGFSGLGT